MPRPAALVRRSLIFVHRWLGVALSILFLLWFVSGIVMMYWTFPGVTERDRLERAPALDPSRITVSPEQAVAALDAGDPGEIVLTSFDGRPVYQIDGIKVFADDATVQLEVDSGTIDGAAAAWAGKPLTEARKESIEEVDQWTVAGELATMRPLYKYSWPDGQQVYVDGDTAVVEQYTTTASRIWAYLGAIPHWLYFTPLRQHQPEWLAFVVWSSLIGGVSTLIGLIVGVWMYSPRKRYRHAGTPTSIPYRGWKRWHTITGLVFGVLTTTWALSGTLSMGPFPAMDRLVDLTVGQAPPTRVNLADALRGVAKFDLSSYADKSAREALASLEGFEVKRVEFASFAGAPVYLASNGVGETRIVPVHGSPMAAFETEEIMRVVREAAGTRLAELRVLEEYDAYYLNRLEARPLPVVYARMNDGVNTRYYIDPRTGRVVTTYSARGWVNRWLYHGLHSLDFPWLYNYRPLWDIVVIVLMLGGTAVCVTSLVLAWRVLERRLVAILHVHLNPPDEDLPLDAKA